MGASGHEEVLRRLQERHLVSEVEAICAREHARLEDVLGRLRRSSVVRTRRLVWAWCRAELGMSYTELGELFGVDGATARAGVLAVAEDRRAA